MVGNEYEEELGSMMRMGECDEGGGGERQVTILDKVVYW